MCSDRPSAGAVPVDLPPPNVVSPPAAQPKTGGPAASAAAPTYRRLVIQRPAEQDMVHSNNGAFGITANLSPPLRPNDRVRVLLDGNLVPTVFRSTNLRLSEADWQAAAVGSNSEHTLRPGALLPARRGSGRQAALGPPQALRGLSATGAPAAFQAPKPPSMCAT